MSFTEYQFENNEARDIKILGKDIGYISQNYAQSFNEHIRLENNSSQYTVLTMMQVVLKH